jgi:hypothetical protein
MVMTRLLASSLLIGAACTGDPFVTPVSSELFFCAVLGPPGGKVVTPTTSDTALYAFLLEAGTPINSPYVTADRFEMRRVSDGALLDWRPNTPAKPRVVLSGGLLTEDGNYVLPLHGAAGRLGRIDLVPGDQYELFVDVGTVAIRGSVSMPAVPQAAFESNDPVPVLSWKPVVGAGGYSVTTQDFMPTFAFTRDTVFHFDGPIGIDNISGIGTIVRAYEPQLFSYLADPHVGRAGITGALGVFGAYNSRALPPR